MQFVGTWWAVVPPIFAILLAFLTKKVYLSLFAGCVLGALMVADFQLWAAFDVLFNTMADNMDLMILIFDVLLGMIIVPLVNSGGSAAYGNWASKKITSKRGAMLSTSALGVLIFVDDYFNCLTVGNVMRPVTDKYKVSRAKLAYIIDATAAPVCILAPISSWAAAVSSYIPEGYDINGFQMFMQAIPYNFYAILTLVMVFVTSYFLFDFGKMKKHELAAANGDLFFGSNDEYADASKEVVKEKAKVADLILPVLVLIVSAIFAMIVTGYKNGATTVVDAFANCSATLSLVFATFVTIIFMAILYLPRKIVSFDFFAESIVDGFKVMVPSVSVLILAWTLKGLVDQLDVATYVNTLFKANSGLASFMPMLMFLVACFLGFSTGTSWGTMGILIPVAVPMFYENPQMMIIAIAAILAGSVCGDHISPISDTTIMSSAGAQCNHLNHVGTQMQYAMVMIVISAVMYLISGFVPQWQITLPLGIVLTVVVLFVLRAISNKKDAKAADAE
ncbi:MAG: Na+/H+ antiporter NhaC family protein [Clostridia bacterium]|nr:Na+/H+ antiporter NhaC family protein [Clostridia bacterium]